MSVYSGEHPANLIALQRGRNRDDERAKLGDDYAANGWANCDYPNVGLDTLAGEPVTNEGAQSRVGNRYACRVLGNVRSVQFRGDNRDAAGRPSNRDQEIAGPDPGTAVL